MQNKEDLGFTFLTLHLYDKVSAYLQTWFCYF